jgi:hypothetical protein
MWSKIDITILISTEYILHKWGFKQKVPRKVHINTASTEEKEDFKKQPRGYWTLCQKDLQQYH